MAEANPFKFGDEVRDIHTGLKGVVTGKAEYITGDQSLNVEALDQTGRGYSVWIDVKRCELVERAAATPAPPTFT